MASRCHWRFVVRDAYGNAIQNAAVYVYQPGTTTDFTGAAYDAYTGGSAKTNPFISNAQGEVEGFFDTNQRVDVLVTDNNDTAYKAVDPSTVISFTSFTEGDEIRPANADIPASVGIAGDLVAAIVNSFTTIAAAPGTSGRWADAAHQHPYTALTPAAASDLRSTAGAGTATNPARSDHLHPLWVGTTMPTRTSQLALSNSTTETAVATLTVPANQVAAGSTFAIKVKFYTTNSTTSRVLTFRLRWGGTAGVVLGGTWAITGSTTAGTDEAGFVEGLVTVRTIGGTGSAVGDLWGFEALSQTAAVPVFGGSAVTAAATIDTTVAKDLVLTATWGTAGSDVTLKVDTVYIAQVA